MTHRNPGDFGIDGLRTNLRSAVAKMPWAFKRLLLISLDFIMLSGAVWFAYSLRFGHWLVPNSHQFASILLAPIVAVPIFIRMGLYRAVIRYLPERAFWTIAKAVVISTLVWIVVLFAAEIVRLATVPRSATAIYGILAILLVGGSRFAMKYLLWAPDNIGNLKSGQVIIYGAGSTGAQVADALRREHKRYVVGFIDDDPRLKNREVAGVRVYAPERLRDLMTTTGAKEVVLCMPSITSVRRAEIVSQLSALHARIRALPTMGDLATGRYLVSQIREIDIDDLLGRSAIPADPALMRQMVEGRSIMVTGAGGSIGSELCRLIVKWRPRTLILFEQNEFALYQIERQLRKRSDIPVVTVLGSVGNAALVNRALRMHGVQVVFHAAAYKHVPLVEANVLEGIRNNIIGTRTLVSAAFEQDVEHFVLISTDKAVRPTNVMGATKRAAELIVREFAERAAALGKRQKFSAVRFGNVLGSNGSVVPLFKEQIANGGPVTLTDDQMTRYFMSIHEAAELIVQAGALSESGDIFVLDMGDPVRIRDLAEHMIRLTGLMVNDEANPNGDIEISVIGRRPGEKMHEELFYDMDGVERTAQPKIMRSTSFDGARVNIGAEIAEIVQAVENEDEVAARRILFELIGERSEAAADMSQVVSLSSVRKA